MHGLWRLNRTETVAVQTNYVPAQDELQVSDAMAGDAAFNSLYVSAGPRGAPIYKSRAVGVIPRASPYDRRNSAFRKASVRSHASAAAAAS
jgi:hypothetical protein